MQSSLRGPFNGAFVHQVERLFHHGTSVGLTEGELLERFVRGRDEAAFEALIARHGPMVLGVCRRLLRDPNDVDDAFQATFLVLVRRAGSLRRCDLLGNWLYGVAHRVAKRAQILAARRLARTPHGPDVVDQLDASAGRRNGDDPAMHDPEPTPWLHEEVRRLPEKYRTVVLLCYFEGLTYEEAAARLGCPVGTIKGRLSRAREMLRKRLLRRGVAVSPAALDWHLALPDLRIAVPEPLKHATLRAALSIAGTSGGSMAAASSVSLSVATLTEGVLRTMNPANLKAVSFAFLVAGTVTAGLVIAAAQGPAEPDHLDDPPSAETETAQQGEPVAPRKAADRRPEMKKQKAAASPDASPNPGPAGAGPQRASAGADMATGKSWAGSEPVGPGGMSGNVAGPAGGRGLDGGGFGGESGEDAASIRQNIAELAAKLAVRNKTPQNEAILQELDKPLAMAFAKPTPLDEVLKYIKARTTNANGQRIIPIYVDPQGLAAAGVEPGATVIIDLDGVPLKTSLRLLLKQLDLAYCVRDGVLIISSVEGINEELAEALRELMGSGKNDRGVGAMGGMRGTGGMGGGMGMM
jgi:RNA polymerase sigma factor (sigma-70 family)